MISIASPARRRMIPTQCAICETSGNAQTLYPPKLPQQKIESRAFDPRRETHDYHYQIVRCNTCGLVRSDPVLEDTQLADLYARSEFSYESARDIKPLARTYSRYLARLVRYHPKFDSFLEIGCGNGFFLEEAKRLGFKSVSGVEPSEDAVAKAPPAVKEHITLGMFDGKIFQPESFSVVSFFQTLDHISEPNSFLQDVHSVLKPGGFVLAINHNVRSFSSRILGEQCPIIDIGHAYLYDLATMKNIFEKNALRVREVFPVTNTVSIDYLLELLPLPGFFKKTLKSTSRALGINLLTAPIRLGNLGLIAQKC